MSSIPTLNPTPNLRNVAWTDLSVGNFLGQGGYSKVYVTGKRSVEQKRLKIPGAW